MEPGDYDDIASTPAPVSPRPLFPDDNRREDDATAVATSEPVAPTARHLYTMTVDQVASELYTYSVYRDERTIQRWCKSGKLRAILDREQGDRYLIDPASVRDVVATLVAERDRQPARPQATPRHRPDSVGDIGSASDGAATTRQFTHESHPDNRSDAATIDPTYAAAGGSGRDEVAALQRRVAELENEKNMLMVDKQVREQMVDYIKDQFQGMMDEALKRSEEVGQLRAENTQLRTLLPPDSQRSASELKVPPRFTPHHVTKQQTDPVHRNESWSSSAEGYNDRIPS